MRGLNRHLGLLPRRGVLAVLAAGSLAVWAAVATPAMAEPTAEDAEIWKSIAEDLYGNREIVEGTENVVLDAPYRALDAAIVPLTIEIPAAIAPDVERLTLVVDKNPAPIVARFTYGEAAGLGARKLATRVRVDMYSNVRAIVEMKDGRLFMATKYVKAAGGCSAPALKDMDAALANVGKMKVRAPGAEDASALTREAQLMIRHPNYSGMQMNQVTGYYIPAKYVEKITVKKGGALVFDMTGGISLSEDPNIRFTYAAGDTEPLHVEARDTDGKVFETTVTPAGT